MLCPDDDAESCARPHNAPPRSLPRLRRRRSARRRRDQEGRRDTANPVNLGTPTITSSRAFPASATSPVRACSPRLATTRNDSETPEVSSVRRRGADHRASGRSTSITRRRVKNNRLAAPGFVWAFPRPGPAKDPRTGRVPPEAGTPRDPPPKRVVDYSRLGQMSAEG